MNPTKSQVTNLNKLFDRRDQIKAELKTIEDQIKDYFRRLETDEIETNRYKASYKSITSKRFDSKRFKDNNPELHEAYTTESVSSRLTIKEVK